MCLNKFLCTKEMPVKQAKCLDSKKCNASCDSRLKRGIVSAAKMIATRVGKDNYLVCKKSARSSGVSAENTNFPVRDDCVSECGNCFHNSCAKCSPLHACQRGNPDSTLPVTYPSPLVSISTYRLFIYFYIYKFENFPRS